MMKSLFTLKNHDSPRALARRRVRPGLVLAVAVAVWAWLPMDCKDRSSEAAASRHPMSLEKAALAMKKPWRPGWRVHARSVVSALRFVLDLDAPVRALPPHMASPPSMPVWALSTNQPGETPAI